MSENTVEIRRICRLLRTTVELAEQANLTGSLQQGVQNCTRQYNTIVTHLEQTGVIAKGFFYPLPIDTSFDEVGVASAQLASYLDDEELPTQTVTYSGPKYNIINNNSPSPQANEDKERVRQERDTPEERHILQSILSTEEPDIEREDKL